MAEQRKGGRRRNGRRVEPYVHRSPAVCVVVYDPSGRVMPDEVAAQIAGSIHAVAEENGYLVSVTRT